MKRLPCIHDAAGHDWIGGDEKTFAEGLLHCDPPDGLSFRLLCDYAMHDDEMARKIADVGGRGAFRAVVGMRFTEASVYMVAVRSVERWHFRYASTAEEAERLIPRLVTVDGDTAS